jgi:transcriptional regulator with XRE-family HTH domain
MGTADTGRGTDFAHLLREQRLSQGCTQEELAERAGLSVRGLRYLEQGVRRPQRDTVQRLIGALALGPSDARALLAAARPRVRAETPSRGGRLPVPAGSLIGRERETGLATGCCCGTTSGS